MTTRRTFLAGTLAAAAAAALPSAPRAEARPAQRKSRPRTATEIFVKDTGGTGRAVVMTHAWPLSADSLGLSGGRAGRRPAFASSPTTAAASAAPSQPAAGYDFDTFADDLAAVIDQTGVRDATLVGYSMGGGEVVRYFSRHGGTQVAKAALVGAAAYYLLKTEDNPDGIDGAVFDGIKQGVLGDRKAYLAGLADGRVPRRQAAGDQSGHPGDGRRSACHRHAGRASRPRSAASTPSARPTSAPSLPRSRCRRWCCTARPTFRSRSRWRKATAAGIAQSKMIEYQDASHGIVAYRARSRHPRSAGLRRS